MSLGVQHPCILVPLLLSGLQSRPSRPQVAPERAPAPPSPQHGDSISSHQSGMPQDRGVWSNDGPQLHHGKEVGVDYDISARHQSQNRCPCPPSPTYLTGTISSEKHRSKKLRSNAVSHVQGRLHSEEDSLGDSSSLVSEHCATIAMDNHLVGSCRHGSTL
ncbi:hypothetical protein EDD15DRAFT_2196044 [Pisolithus albus]|nr:hypothetical protein EDD15DRAFT_2196044 [Pisolithus albus]